MKVSSGMSSLGATVPSFTGSNFILHGYLTFPSRTSSGHSSFFSLNQVEAVLKTPTNFPPSFLDPLLITWKMSASPSLIKFLMPFESS